MSFFALNTSGFQLNCSSLDSAFDCSSLDIFTKDKNITSVSNYIESFNISRFSIPKESESNFVPSGVCKFYPMTTFEISGKNVKEISRQVFVHCDNVETLHITGTQIFWLPENSFSFLVNLNTLKLDGNQLKYLPMNLLSQNKILKTFAAKNNRIEMIDLKFDQSVAVVSLQSNECVDDFVVGYDKIKQLNGMLQRICKSSKQVEIMEEWENIAHEGTTILSETSGLKSIHKIYDRISQVVKLQQVTSLIDDLKHKTLLENESCASKSKTMNEILMTCQGEKIELKNNFTNIFNISADQKSFISELIIDITSLKKLIKFDNKTSLSLDFSTTILNENTSEKVAVTSTVFDASSFEYSTTFLDVESSSEPPSQTKESTVEKVAKKTLNQADIKVQNCQESSTKDDENLVLVLTTLLLVSCIICLILVAALVMLWKVSKSQSYELKQDKRFSDEK